MALASAGRLSRRAMLLATSSTSLLTSRPLSVSAKPSGPRTQRYEVVVIADNDSGSSSRAEGSSFISYLAHFTITSGAGRDTSYELKTLPLPKVSRISPGITPIAPPGLRLITRFSYGGRGGELSDLLLVPGVDGGHAQRLLTFDDRTGIVFEVMPTEHESVHHTFSTWELWHGRQLLEPSYSTVSLVPRWILSDGAGNRSTGFKCEWSAIKGGKVVVGSHGYEVWMGGPPYITGRGMRNVQWVKEIDTTTGQVQHVDWSNTYNAVSAALGVVPPGYVTHEAAAWSDTHGRWFFMPRRVSPNSGWDPVMDGQRGANVLVSCKEGGEDVQVVQLRGPTTPERGFSAMRFVPGTGDTHIIATKTIERAPGEPCETYVTVVGIDGEVLLPETQISDRIKFEGLEILTASA